MDAESTVREHRRALPLDAGAAAGVWAERFRRNNLLTYATAIALQLVVAGAALAFLALALLDALGANGVWTRHVAPVVAAHVPHAWYVALRSAVSRELHARDATLILVGVAVVVWEVSGAIRTVMGALNRIYEAEESRGFVRRFGTSFALAVPVAALAMLAGYVWLGGLHVAAGWIDWPLRVLVAAALLWCVVAAVVLVAPAKRQPWRWSSAGSLAIVLAWLAVTALYGWWIGNVVDFRQAEGALAAAVSTTGYLYASAIAFLVGAQLDELLREGGAAQALGWRASRRSG